MEGRAQQERSDFLLGGEQGLNIIRTQGSGVPGASRGQAGALLHTCTQEGPGNTPHPARHLREWLTPFKLYSMQTNCSWGTGGGGP